MAAAPTTKAPATTSKPATPAAKATPAKASRAAAAPVAGKGAAKSAPNPGPPATVTLKHLSAELAERHAMAKKQADAVVADVFGMLVAHLKAGERLRIGGLGVLEVKDRPARMGRNPATGAAIQVKASKKVAFRAAKELKDAI